MDLDLDGGLNLDETITSRIDLADIHAAFDPLRTGDAAHQVIGSDA